MREFLDAAKAIGGPVEEQALALQKLLLAQRLFLSIVPFSNKPGPKVWELAQRSSLFLCRRSFSVCHLSLMPLPQQVYPLLLDAQNDASFEVTVSRPLRLALSARIGNSIR